MGDFLAVGPVERIQFEESLGATEVHPDGERVALGLGDGTVVIRDLESARETARFHRGGLSVSTPSRTPAIHARLQVDNGVPCPPSHLNRESYFPQSRAIPPAVTPITIPVKFWLASFRCEESRGVRIEPFPIK